MKRLWQETYQSSPFVARIVHEDGQPLEVYHPFSLSQLLDERVEIIDMPMSREREFDRLVEGEHHVPDYTDPEHQYEGHRSRNAVCVRCTRISTRASIAAICAGENHEPFGGSIVCP